jgi:thiol-disulfide isomerase/thioredoxin
MGIQSPKESEMKKFKLSSIIMLSLSAIIIATVVVSAESKSVQKPELLVVKYDADWCFSCKELDKVLPDVKKALADEPVLFVTLDLTDDISKKHTEMLVSVLGIQEDWVDMKGYTGLINVIDPKTKERLTQLNMVHSAETMVDMIREHLK